MDRFLEFIGGFVVPCIIGASGFVLLVVTMCAVANALKEGASDEPRVCDAELPRDMPAPFGAGQQFATVDQLMPSVVEVEP